MLDYISAHMTFGDGITIFIAGVSINANFRVIKTYERLVELYLFLVRALLADELVKHGSILLVNLLHFIYVTGHFVHSFHRNYQKIRDLIVS